MSIEMPILRPVPIPTKGLGFWQRIKVWRHTTRKWEVMEDWDYPGFGTIPKGFVFDGASIPRPLWWFLSPVGLLLIPGLIHDWGYRENPGGAGPNDRKLWDMFFRQIIKEVTDTTIIPWIAYFAVRIGGWKAWKEHRKNDTNMV